jgi:hypothetical protein
VECRLARVELRSGKAPWIPVPPVLRHTVGLFVRPSASIAPLSEPGHAHVGVRWALVDLEMVASVESGRLVLSADGHGSGLLDDVYTGVDGWVDSLNAWIAGNGYRLAPLEVVAGRIALRKERLSVA